MKIKSLVALISFALPLAFCLITFAIATFDILESNYRIHHQLEYKTICTGDDHFYLGMILVPMLLVASVSAFIAYLMKFGGINSTWYFKSIPFALSLLCLSIGVIKIRGYINAVNFVNNIPASEYRPSLLLEATFELGYGLSLSVLSMLLIIMLMKSGRAEPLSL